MRLMLIVGVGGGVVGWAWQIKGAEQAQDMYT